MRGPGGTRIAGPARPERRVIESGAEKEGDREREREEEREEGERRDRFSCDTP